MFDLPEAKCVRREELVSSTSSSPPEPEGYEAAAQARLRDLFAVDKTQPVASLHGLTDDGASVNVSVVAEEDAFEFRLFAAPKTDSKPLEDQVATRIAIRSPTPETSLPAFVTASRPDSYYFAISRTKGELETYRTAAVSGQDVINESQRRWPGNELPWRLVTIKANGKGEFLGSETKTSRIEPRPGRKRDGKKKRIAIRKKLVAIRSKQEKEAIEKAAKEAAEKEKRTQRNREKKVKKKIRDKAKKASMLEEAATDLQQHST